MIADSAAMIGVCNLQWLERARNYMSTTVVVNENKANQVEAIKAETTVVLYELSEAQSKAVEKMQKTAELTAIAKSVISSRIKGMYKGFKDGAEKGLAQVYDDSSRRGAKWDVSKADFIKKEMAEVNELFNKL